MTHDKGHYCIVVADSCIPTSPTKWAKLWYRIKHFFRLNKCHNKKCSSYEWCKKNIPCKLFDIQDIYKDAAKNIADKIDRDILESFKNGTWELK